MEQKIIIAIVTAFIAFLFTLLYWRFTKRAEFRESMRLILRELETEEAVLAEPIYRKNIQAVRDACAKFEGYVLPWNRHAFDTAWREYCSMNENELDPKCDMENYPFDSQKLLFLNYELRKKKICDRLNNLIALSV